MDYDNIKLRMDKIIDYLKEQLAAIRVGRANPAILNKVALDYYGTFTAINQLATISVPEARQILITPWDKSLISSIVKAIEKADIGINPINDGNSIRLVFPELSEDRRKEISKDVKALGEDAKIAIRNERREALDVAKALEKKSEITEDELKDQENEIQKITDKYIDSIDKIIDDKTDQVMQI